MTVLGFWFKTSGMSTESSVRLISITPDAEKLIGYCARVSNPANQDNPEVSKLLAYCIRHGHWSIFEQANMVVEITTSRAIAPQILRHRSFCLAGDTQLTFEMPAGSKTGKRASYKRSLEDICRKFNEGTQPVPRRSLSWDLSRIEGDKSYSPRALSALIGIAPENVRTLCQKQTLPHQKIDGRIKIKGQAVLDYAQAASQKTWISPLRERVANMRLRCFDEKSKTFTTTKILDVWQSGVKPAFKIYTENGYSLTLTDNHKILSKNGYQSLKEGLNLKLTGTKAHFDADKSMYVACNGQALHQSGEWLKAKRSQTPILSVAEIANEAGVSDHTIRKWLRIHNLQFAGQERHAVLERRDGIWNRGKTGYTIARRGVFGGFHSLEAREESRGNTLTVAYSKITRVEYVGMIPVYDLSVEHSDHNFVANGIVVHNCFQEFSQRYATADSYVSYTPRRQDVKNRQNSVDDLPAADKEWFAAAEQEIWDLAQARYQEALNKGIAKECARFLLPLNTKTRLYMNGTVRSWIHYIQLRSGQGTQLEHMQIAEACKKIFVEQLPIIAKAMGWVTEAAPAAEAAPANLETVLTTT